MAKIAVVVYNYKEFSFFPFWDNSFSNLDVSW